MANGSDKPKLEYGSELRKRMSPELAAREQKKARSAGLFGIGMGVVALALGVNSMRTGEWVSWGREYSGLELPGFVVVLIGLSIILGSGEVIRRFGRKL